MDLKECTIQINLFKMVEIKIPFKTPTVNHLYGHTMRGAFYIKPEARKLRKEIVEICEKVSLEDLGAYERLKLVVEIHEDWFCKNGSVKKKDVANREKFLIDSVFGGLGIDDKFIFEHTTIKKQSDQEYSIIKIFSI